MILSVQGKLYYKLETTEYININRKQKALVKATFRKKKLNDSIHRIKILNFVDAREVVYTVV